MIDTVKNFYLQIINYIVNLFMKKSEIQAGIDKLNKKLGYNRYFMIGKVIYVCDEFGIGPTKKLSKTEFLSIVNKN